MANNRMVLRRGTLLPTDVTVSRAIGVTDFSGQQHYNPRLSKLELVAFDVLWGLHSGIPLCCVLNFIWTAYGRCLAPSRARGEAHPGAYDLDFVPCEMHATELECGHARRLTEISICDCKERQGFVCSLMLAWLTSQQRRAAA